MNQASTSLTVRPPESEITKAQCELLTSPISFLNKGIDALERNLSDVENRDEIRREARLVLLAQTPGTRSEIKEIVFRILNHYESFDRRSIESKAMLVDDWLESLAEWPADVLRGMAKAWRENPKSEYFPTVGKVIDEIPAQFKDRYKAMYSAQQVAKQEWF